ncbi:MAG: universal stress protein [Firmicutes bacterium]|nr:universal stress protein [Bacillota bacterium]
MYKKILSPVDGSERSKQAAAHAASLAKIVGAQLILVHVVTPVSMYSDRLGGIEKTLLDELVKEGQQILTKIKWDLSSEDTEIETTLLIGNPADEIFKLTTDNSYDLIVMGSRGLGELKGYIMGSVSNRVVRHAKCPVLIYR